MKADLPVGKAVL